MATIDGNVRMQVIVEENTPDGVFRDAIYMSKAEFDAATDQEIADLKADRVTKWRNFIAAERVKPPKNPAKAELQQLKQDLQDQKALIQTQIDDLTAKIALL